jgi:hypothetical protein
VAEFDKIDLKTPVMQHLSELRAKLQFNNQTAQQLHAQQLQNLERNRRDEWSTNKILEIGSLMLLLQPTSTTKFLRHWLDHAYRVII